MHAEVKDLLGPLDWEQAQQRLEGFERLASAESLRTYGFVAFLVLLALGALLLLAWVFWPRGKVLTLRGWRRTEEAPEEPGAARGGAGPARGGWRLERAVAGCAGGALLGVLGAMGSQVQIDRSRGFLADTHRRMQRELRQATAQAHAQVLKRHGLEEPVRFTPQLAEEVKKAENHARDEVVKDHYLYLPQGGSLRYLSLGNSGLAADYLWLTSLQYVSSPFRQGQKFDLMHHFYQEILDLDPHWIEIHLNAGKVLSALDPDRFRTELFFCRAITRNPGNYQLPLEAGKLYVVPPPDPDLLKEYSRKASEFLECARERKELPSEERAMLENLIGQLKEEAGFNAAAASRYLAVVRDPNAPQSLRETCAREWLQAESRVRENTLEEQARLFKQEAGRWPKNLRELFQGKGTPLDAFGLPFEYDAETGQVSSHGIKALLAKRSARIIEDLAKIFRSSRERFPRDLQELSAFAREYFAPPNTPTFPVVEAIGKKLDCTRNPLGGAWDYNRETGEIRLPPECNLTELYRNSSGVLEGRLPPPFAP